MKHTKNDLPESTSGEWADALARIVPAIENPADYYVGRRAVALPLPENVLLYQRSRPPARGRDYHHYRFGLVMNLRARGRVVLDDVYFHLDPGQAILIFPYQYHSFRFERPDEEILWLFLSFESGRPEEFLPLRDRPMALSPAALEAAFHVATAFLRVPPAPRGDNAVVLGAARLLNELLETAERGEGVAAAPARGDPMETVMRVSRYVDARMGEGIGVKEIAAFLGMSASGLRAFFRRTLRVPLGRFLRDKRMLRAMTLLGTSDLRLAAIAARCGFSTPYALSRAFKTEKRISPKEYRRRHGRGAPPPAPPAALAASPRPAPPAEGCPL